MSITEPEKPRGPYTAASAALFDQDRPISRPSFRKARKKTTERAKTAGISLGVDVRRRLPLRVRSDDHGYHHTTTLVSRPAKWHNVFITSRNRLHQHRYLGTKNTRVFINSTSSYQYNIWNSSSTCPYCFRSLRPGPATFCFRSRASLALAIWPQIWILSFGMRWSIHSCSVCICFFARGFVGFEDVDI